MELGLGSNRPLTGLADLGEQMPIPNGYDRNSKGERQCNIHRPPDPLQRANPDRGNGPGRDDLVDPVEDLVAFHEPAITAKATGR